MASIATASVHIVPSFDGLHRSTKKAIAGTAPTFEAEGRKSSSKFGAALKLGVGSAAIAAGTALATAMGIAVTNGFKRLDAIDKAEKKLEGLGHSAEAVEGIMNNALNSVKGTAFGLDEAATVATALVASGIKPGQELEKTLKTVADSATIAGIGMDEMGAIFGKVAASGKLQGDELNQLSERGVPALQLLSDHLGLTAEKTRKMVSQGKVDFETFAAAMDAGMGGAAQKSGETFSGALANVKAALGRIGATFLEPFFNAAKDSFNILTPALDSIGEAVKPLAAALGGIVEQVMPVAVAAFQGFVDVVVASVSWLGDHVGLLNVLGGLILATAGAYILWNAGLLIHNGLSWASYLWASKDVLIKAIQIGLTNTLTGAWAKLNAAMAANPIGLVIIAIVALIAVFVLMYKKVDWFRNAVNAAWEWMKNAAAAVVAWFQSTVVPVLAAVWQAIAQGAVWLWQNVIVPVWAAIQAAVAVVVGWFQTDVVPVISAAMAVIGQVVTWLWNTIIKPYFAFIQAYIGVVIAVVKVIFQGIVWFVQTILAPVFTFLWNAMQVAFGFIMAVIRVAWVVIQAIFKAIVWFVQTILAPVFTFLWNVIKIAFAIIGTIIRGWWIAAQIIFQAAVAFFKTVLAPAVTWLYNTIFKPIFDAIGLLVRTWWAGVQIIFNAVVSFIKNTLGPSFTALYRAVIKPAWDNIQSVIQTVWNFIRDKIFGPLKKAVSETVPTAFKNGVEAIEKFWKGLEGTAKKPVKFVVQTVLNNGLIKKFNEIAGKFPGAPTLKEISLPKGFARGGWTGPGSRLQPAGIVHADEFVVKKASRRRFERAHPGVLDHINRTGQLPIFGAYAGGGAVGTLTAAAKWWQDLGAKITEFKAWGQRVGRHSNGSLHYSGRAFDANYGPGGESAIEKKFFDSHMSAFKSAFPKIRVIWRAPNHFNHAHFDTSNGADIGDVAGGGGGFDITSIFSPFTDMQNKLKEQFSKWGDVGSVVAAMGKKTLALPIDWIKNNAAKFFGDVADKVNEAVDTVTTRAAKEGVRTAAMGYGWAFGDQWNAIDWIVNKESSWNTKAANPSSSARGLFQKMTSIHGPVESTAFGQAKWGLKYIKERYGTPVAAKKFHESHGYYDKGGQVRPTLYDKGGWLPPGLTLTNNLTGKPEAVFTQRQLDQLTQSRGDAINITVNGVKADNANDVAQAIRFELIRQGRGGKYAPA